jgi:hypothetical protein
MILVVSDLAASVGGAMAVLGATLAADEGGAGGSALSVTALVFAIDDRGSGWESKATVQLRARSSRTDCVLERHTNDLLALLGERATGATIRRWADVLTIARPNGDDASTKRTKRRDGNGGDADAAASKTVAIELEWRVVRCFDEIGASRADAPHDDESAARALHRFFALLAIRAPFAIRASYSAVAGPSFTVEHSPGEKRGGGATFAALGSDAARVLSAPSFRLLAKGGVRTSATVGTEAVGATMLASTARAHAAHARRCTALLRPRGLCAVEGVDVTVVALDGDGVPQQRDSPLFRAAMRAATEVSWSLLHLRSCAAESGADGASESAHGRDGAIYTRNIALEAAPGEAWEELFRIESMTFLFEFDIGDSERVSGADDGGDVHRTAVASATRALRAVVKEARYLAYRGYAGACLRPHPPRSLFFFFSISLLSIAHAVFRVPRPTQRAR